MPSHAFEIRPAGDNSSGTCVIGGRELSFYKGASPDPMQLPLHAVAIAKFLSDGLLTGVVVVTAE